MDQHGCASTSSSLVSVWTLSQSGGPSHATGPVQFGYFVNWGIYARKYFPWDVPVQSLTHILYSFADVRPETGEVFLTDAWADEQIRFTDPSLAPTLQATHAGPIDTWNDDPEAGPQLFGTFKRFNYLKQANRHLKLLLSIGGWTFSSHFWPTLSNPQNRDTFATSAVQLLEDYGLDGIDSTFLLFLSSTPFFSWSALLALNQRCIATVGGGTDLYGLCVVVFVVEQSTGNTPTTRSKPLRTFNSWVPYAPS